MPQDQVIVVDDNSKDGTVEIARTLPLAIIIGMKETRGTAATRNPAITSRSRKKGISSFSIEA